MGNRLSRIVTRTGDDGSTGLADGTRRRKHEPRIEAMGAVDELNSALGLLLAVPALPMAIAESLTDCQHELFDLGGELALPGATVITTANCARLETEVERHNESLPPLKEFILPGGGEAAARCHLARSIARRAERRCWALNEIEPLNAESLRYLNRLSDLLFVLARVLARAEGGEVLWTPQRSAESTTQG